MKIENITSVAHTEEAVIEYATNFFRRIDKLIAFLPPKMPISLMSAKKISQKSGNLMRKINAALYTVQGPVMSKEEVEYLFNFQVLKFHETYKLQPSALRYLVHRQNLLRQSKNSKNNAAIHSIELFVPTQFDSIALREEPGKIEADHQRHILCLQKKEKIKCNPLPYQKRAELDKLIIDDVRSILNKMEDNSV